MELLNKNNLLIYSCLAFFLLLFIGCNCNKQIVVDDALKANSQNWKATIKKGLFSIGSSNFGPYKTINAIKLDSAILKSSTKKFWKIPIFESNSTTKKRKVYSLDVLCNNETAKVILYVWYNTDERVPGLLSIFRDEEINEIKDANGEIKINNSIDNVWSFKINSYGIDEISSPKYIYSIETSGFLAHSTDTINITSATKYANGKSGYVHTKGIILNYKNQPIAALQLLEQNYVWIRNDLPNDTKLAISGLFSAILGTKDL